MNKTSVLTFIFGVGIGAAVSYLVTKDYYEGVIDEEVASVKEAYSRSTDAVIQKPTTASNTNYNKPDLAEFMAQTQKHDYTAYSSEVAEDAKDEEVKDEMVDPYIITEPSFNDDNPDYEKLSFTYYANGILTDDANKPLENPEPIVGDALNEFEDPETDVVYVRNDILCADYEICRDLEDY